MTTPNSIIAPIGGLASNRNEITTPSGICTDALNVIFTKPGVAERRRGLTNVSSTNAFGARGNLNGMTQQFLESDKQDFFLHKGNKLYAENGSSSFGHVGFADGWNLFPYAIGIPSDSDRYIYIGANSAFWRLDQMTGRVSLIAGLPGVTGTTDGTGTAARFSSIRGIAFASNNSSTAYVTDNHSVRTINVSTGAVAVLAGLAGTTGTTNATGTSARFNTPIGIVFVNTTDMYVCDSVNHTVRNVTTAGVVTTPYGSAGVSANTDANGTSSRFGTPWGICFDGTNCFVTTTGFHNVRKIVVSTTAVSTLAGSTTGATGTTDATGTAARFNTPYGVCVANDIIYVCDQTNDRLRKIIASTGVVSTEIASSGGASVMPNQIGNPYAIACFYDSSSSGVLRHEVYFSGGDASAGSTPRGMARFSETSSQRFAVLYSAENAGLGSPRVSPYMTGLFTALDAVGAWENGNIGYSGTSFDFGARIRHADMAKSTYITSAQGVRKIDRTQSFVSGNLQSTYTSRMAGAPRGLAPTLALSSAGTPTLLAVSAQRAYRVVFGRFDANSVLQLGAPSERAVISNTAGATRDVTVTVQIPHDVNTTDIYQIYATAVASGADPGDECALIREGSPTTAEIEAGALSFVDAVPDALRGADLYTNATQEGLENANERPPLARDMCEFRNHMLFANFTDKHRLFLQMIGTATFVTGTSKITIGGVVFNAEAAESIAAGNFQVFTAGTASQNIENTARSLARVINGYTANTEFYAFYESPVNGAPGSILIEERSPGGSGFSVTANNAACGNAFSPPLPPGTGAPSSISSVADRGKSRVRVSKSGEPEACPVYRDVQVGSEDDELLRIIPLRDSVVCIKQRSIWRIVGSEFFDFVAARIDDTRKCAFRDSAAKLDNAAIFLSNQGFVAVTENDVVSLSEAERDRHLLLSRIASDYPSHVTATSIERQRVYLCTSPMLDLDIFSDPASVSNDQIMCWNVDGQAWSRWSIGGDPLGRYGARVSALGVADDRCVAGVMGGTSERYPVYFQREQSQLARDEYEEFSTVCSFTAGAIVEGKQRLTNLVVGGAGITTAMAFIPSGAAYQWGFARQDSSRYVISRDADGYYVTRSTGLTSLPFTAGANSGVTIKCAIPVLVGVMTPLGNPGELKQQTECVVTVAETEMHDLHVEALSSQDAKLAPNAFAYVGSGAGSANAYANATNDIIPIYAKNFGAGGESATTGLFFELRTMRFLVERSKQIGDWIGLRFYQSTAGCRFEFKGVTLGVRALASNRVRQ